MPKEPCRQEEDLARYGCFHHEVKWELPGYPGHHVKTGLLVTVAASYVHTFSPEKHPGVQTGQLCLFS